MSYFKAKMHQIRFRLGLRHRPLWLRALPRSLAGFKGPTSKEKEGRGREGEGRGRKGVKEGGVEGRGSIEPSPTFSLVYEKPLLQHQAQFGLNPVLH